MANEGPAVGMEESIRGRKKSEREILLVSDHHLFARFFAGVGAIPHLACPDLAIGNTVAPEVTLRLLTIALGIGAVVLLPAVYHLFRVFKGARAK